MNTDKERYMQEYETHDGILLNELEVEQNLGMPALAKLMLNFFGWVLWASLSLSMK